GCRADAVTRLTDPLLRRTVLAAQHRGRTRGAPRYELSSVERGVLRAHSASAVKRNDGGWLAYSARVRLDGRRTVPPSSRGGNGGRARFFASAPARSVSALAHRGVRCPDTARGQERRAGATKLMCRAHVCPDDGRGPRGFPSGDTADARRGMSSIL